jgi:hypothetical protein
MKTTPVYLSRAFVEFGPFTVEEMKNFYSRGLLQEIDHIRPEGSDQWLHVMDWVNSIPATASPGTPAPKPKAPAKKAAPAAKKAAPAAKKAAAPAEKAASKTPKPKD